MLPAAHHPTRATRLATTVVLLATLAAAEGPRAQSAAAGVEMSPGVAFNPHGPQTRAVGLRPLNADETRLVQARAERFYGAVRASASWRQPADRTTLFTTVGGIDPPGVLVQDLIAYWTVPRDVRRRPDGVLTPLLGGAHDLVYFEINRPPRADVLVDPETRGPFVRGVEVAHPGGAFPAPRVFGEVGGGRVYGDLIVFTRDGRDPLEPAPIGGLLDGEVANLRQAVRSMEEGAAERLRGLEASMAPDAVAERRAARERAWSRETRDPAQLAQRLDAAHRSDVSNLERERRDFTPPDTPDPRNRFWGPRLALQAAEATRAALQAEGPSAASRPACARQEPGFSTTYSVRFEVVGARPDCVPMVRVRSDLVVAGRPPGEVQTFTVFFRGSRCGEHWTASVPAPGSGGGRCTYGLPLLREMDWAAARQALGW
jgi:hypothetical protein